MKMWSGRFDQGPDAEFEQWQRSFPFDRVLLPYEVAASKAHAAALAKAGVLSRVELAALLSALEQIGNEGVPEADDPTIEDVHHYVEIARWWKLQAKSVTSCIPGAAAMSRSQPTCACTYANRSDASLASCWSGSLASS